MSRDSGYKTILPLHEGDTGDYSHRKGKEIVGLKMDKDLEGIGSGVFMDNKMESIVLPARLKWISDTAFKGNPIVSITIGENLEGRDSDGIQSSIPDVTAFGDSLRGVHTQEPALRGSLGALKKGMYPESNHLTRTTTPLLAAGLLITGQVLLKAIFITTPQRELTSTTG
ncbi:hypothetical protein FACS189491_07840 [Spirochaetia bacterium]|nr:hypothetical protein FACS189491_07840 [Spirochaetia bacterium]